MPNRASKGSAFEREICKRLSLWWTEGLGLEPNENVFWRTSNSGGRSTILNRSGKKTNRHCGDICAIDPIGEPLMKELTLELKRGYARSSLMDMLDKPTGAKKQVYEEWIEQVKKSQKAAGSRDWMVIVKRDRRVPLCITSSPSEASDNVVAIYQDGKKPFYVLTLDNWLSMSDPEAIEYCNREK